MHGEEVFIRNCQMFIATPSKAWDRITKKFLTSQNFTQHNMSIGVYFCLCASALMLLWCGYFFTSRGENTGMYLLVFVCPSFPTLLGLVVAPPSSPSFLYVVEMKTKQSWTWSLLTHTDANTLPVWSRTSSNPDINAAKKVKHSQSAAWLH